MISITFNKFDDGVFTFFNLMISSPEFDLEPNIFLLEDLYLVISFLDGLPMLFLDLSNSCIKTTWHKVL